MLTHESSSYLRAPVLEIANIRESVDNICRVLLEAPKEEFGNATGQELDLAKTIQ